MTTYTTDFSEYTTDATPSDWTDRWHAPASWNVVTNSENYSFGGKGLLVQHSAFVRGLQTWNDIDADANRDDSEVLFRFVNTSSGTTPTNYLGPIIRGSGDSTSEQGYGCQITNSGGYLQLQIFKIVSATFTVLVTSERLEEVCPFAAMGNYWFWVRFRVNGTSLKAKIWTDNQTEPDWILSTTDSAITAAGTVGMWHYAVNTSYDPIIDYFAVGTNGDSPARPSATTGQVDLGAVQVNVASHDGEIALGAMQVNVASHDGEIALGSLYVNIATNPPEAPESAGYAVVCINN